MDWSLDSFFPKFRGEEMLAFDAETSKKLNQAIGLEANLSSFDKDSGVKDWEALILLYEEVTARFSHLSTYLECLCAADANEEAYRAALAALARPEAELVTLQTRLANRLLGLSDEEFSWLLAREGLTKTGFVLDKYRKKARHRMSMDEESLAADLAVDGLGAWSRLYQAIAGTMEFEMKFPDGRTEVLPISQCRSLMTNPDRQVRSAAFAGGNEAWSQTALSTRAALNGISGTRLSLYRRRGVDDFMDPSLQDGHLSRATLDALFAALEAERPAAREILRFKAEKMNEPGIAWYDLEAPIHVVGRPEGEGASLTWERAVELVSRAFHRRYPALGSFFDEMIEKKWIDWSQRPGKMPGGFCATSSFHGESRIFMTFNNCAHDLMTLAHEAGHAWHSRILANERPFAHGYPMTLAESASTFAELIVVQGLMEDEAVDPWIRFSLAEESLLQFSGFLLDIPVRYLFESEVYRRRADGELSVRELNELMAATQSEVFGDTLVEGGENPLFWASKGHFYIDGVSFYNYPYTFGFLLSAALTQRWTEKGDSFLEDYENFLLCSATCSSEEAARKALGADLESVEFWRSAMGGLPKALSQVRELVDRLES